MKEQIKQSLKELDFSHNESKVYLALTELGESTASIIAKKAEVPRTTAISVLENLEKQGFVSHHHFKGKSYFWVESPKTIRDILLNKVSIAEQLDTLLRDLYHAQARFPFAHIYDTKISIKNFIEKTLINLPNKSFIYTIDSPAADNYGKIFSNEFGEVLFQIKNKKNIRTETLVPQGAFKTINRNKLTKQAINIKELPKGIDFSASIWFIDNFLVLFSGEPPFVVAINHKIIVSGFKSIFDFLWGLSN